MSPAKNIKTLQELWDWHKPLVDAENEWKEEQKKNKNKRKNKYYYNKLIGYFNINLQNIFKTLNFTKHDILIRNVIKPPIENLIQTKKWQKRKR